MEDGRKAYRTAKEWPYRINTVWTGRSRLGDGRMGVAAILVCSRIYSAIPKLKAYENTKEGRREVKEVKKKNPVPVMRSYGDPGPAAVFYK